MKIGVIGGTGLYDIEGLEDRRAVRVQTPFGAPSDALAAGRIAGHEVFFLPRHGAGHRLLPSEINHRANVLALKQLGVERVISISAVGSLREELRPRDVVLPDQYFDRTKRGDEHTFFGRGVVAHVAFAQPVCADLRARLAGAARRVLARDPARAGVRVHDGGTYVNMEGPAFSTRAESLYYRRQGFDVIGMTSLAEAKLCREVELCYAAVAMVTDYDAWHDTHEAVSVEQILAHLTANTALARAILREAVADVGAARPCGCARALDAALLTRPAQIPPDRRTELAAILGRFGGAGQP